MTWGRDLKEPVDPTTGKGTEGPGSLERLVSVNRLTDEQLARVKEAYAAESEYLIQNYDQMSEEDLLR